uniref:Uncharacterized protein n=1 Tax=Rhizophora mucronata TaxID=61149 RepID=A0A2P2PIH3_RHIMU
MKINPDYCPFGSRPYLLLGLKYCCFLGTQSSLIFPCF